MSQELTEGIHVSTHCGWAATKEGPFHGLDLYGDGVETKLWNVPLSQATAAVYEIAHAPETFDTAVMQNIRLYVRYLNLETLKDGKGKGQHGRPLQAFRPSGEAWEAFRKAHAIAGEETAKTINFLGVRLEPASFTSLVDYMMTNTCLWAEEPGGEGVDPRVAMVDKFRSAN